MSRAAGIDVGVRKGCDVVVLDGRDVVEHWPGVFPDELAALLGRQDPDVVAIDAPPAYAPTGSTRRAERELMRRGIRLYVTPDEVSGAQLAWYAWMRVGFACFDAIAPTFPRYRGGDYSGHACEVFPHATAVVLSGALPDRNVRKAVHRRAVLERCGIATSGLRTIDALDAALCALTGVIALDGGACVVGDADEGVIVLPATTLPKRYVSTP